MENGVNMKSLCDNIRFPCLYPHFFSNTHSPFPLFMIERDGNIVNIPKLETQLGHIKVFLEGGGGGGGGCDDSSLGSWIADIRKAAFDAEDFIEQYQLVRENPIRLMVNVTFILSPSIHVLHRRICKIVDYINKLDNSIENQRRCASVNNVHISVRECTPCGMDKFLVGLEEVTESLVNKLTDHTNLATVSILGMGGIGKTSLAGRVYTDPTIVGVFDCRMWISVTQHYNYHHVLISILLSISQGIHLNESLGELPVSELETKVRDFLQDKKFLAVLDDVWTQEAWDSVKSAFPDTASRDSRLIVTTRNQELQTGTPHIRHLMKPLNDQQSRELLCQKACIEAGDAEFEHIQSEILSTCAGLPLAIVVVGRELRGERRKEKWEMVNQQLSMLQGPLVQDITNVLAMSYNNLSSDASSCFLRIGFFPKDEEICSNNLIELWEAEGLPLNSSQNDGGKYNLNTLIKMSMIEAAAISSDGTTVKRCKIHPMMHLLAASKAQQEIYFLPEISFETRHGAIFDTTHFSKAPHLRSLLTFQSQGTISSKLLKSICRYSKLLKVLYMKGTKIEKLPNIIGNLWNLRYLNLCDTGIRCLPQSVRNLLRLIILDVRGNPGLEGIKIVKRLKRLRILHLDDSVEPLRIGSLNHLRTLGWVRLQHLKMSDLVNNDNLEVLKVITSDPSTCEEFLQALFNSDTGFCKMSKLKRLHLKVPMPESQRGSSSATGFRLLMEELRNFPDFSIPTLRGRCIQINELVTSGGGFRPHIYVKYANN